MNIKQVLAMPIGQKFGGFDVTIKTWKKRWQVKDKWIQQVVITDESGDALADVLIGKKNNSLGCSVLHITVGIIQEGVIEVSKKSHKKIYIDQFTQPSISEPEDGYDATFDFEKIVTGKIRHGLVCACIRAGFNIYSDEIPKDRIKRLVEFIKTGE